MNALVALTPAATLGRPYRRLPSSLQNKTHSGEAGQLLGTLPAPSVRGTWLPHLASELWMAGRQDPTPAVLPTLSH